MIPEELPQDVIGSVADHAYILREETVSPSAP
jgi:hypothetical protein